MRNERGVALIIVLVVVALLTITVTEFTYSVQLDQHRVRNSIHALQANLLARSGVNLAEGFLMLDQDRRFDAFTEQWWLDLENFCLGVDLGRNMRIRCRVRDESGKININLTRGRRRVRQEQEVTPAAFLRDAMRAIFQNRNIDVQIVDQLADYWEEELPELEDGRRPQVPDFGSLEEFAAKFGITTRQLRRLRPVMTAQPRRLVRRINVNTAPAEVLAAVINDEEAVAEILDRQQADEPFRREADIRPILQHLTDANVIGRLLGVRSVLFRLEASALTNIDPGGERIGGIGQTLSALVLRRCAKAGGDGECVRWTLRPRDWQKEGGARLFWRAQDQDDEDRPERRDESDRG